MIAASTMTKFIFFLGVASQGTPLYDPFFLMSEADYEEAYNFYEDDEDFNEGYADDVIMDGGFFDKASGKKVNQGYEQGDDYVTFHNSLLLEINSFFTIL